MTVRHKTSHIFPPQFEGTGVYWQFSEISAICRQPRQTQSFLHSKFCAPADNAEIAIRRSVFAVEKEKENCETITDTDVNEMLKSKFQAAPTKKIKPSAGAFEQIHIHIHIFMTHLKTLLKKHILTSARKGLNCV